MKRNNVKKGFTLIEVLIAIGILGMLLLSIYRIMLSNTSLYISEKNKLIGIMLINNLINRIEMGGKKLEMFDYGNFKSPYSSFHYEIKAGDVHFGKSEILNIKFVTIKVFWSEKGKKKEINIETYLSNSPLYSR